MSGRAIPPGRYQYVFVGGIDCDVESAHGGFNFDDDGIVSGIWGDPLTARPGPIAEIAAALGRLENGYFGFKRVEGTWKPG